MSGSAAGRGPGRPGSSRRLRTPTGRAAKISAIDAIAVAFAGTYPEPVVPTSDPRDLSALVEHATTPLTIATT